MSNGMIFIPNCSIEITGKDSEKVQIRMRSNHDARESEKEKRT
jgi:hypothetical protein